MHEDKIRSLEKQALEALGHIHDLRSWQENYYKFLGRKSELNAIIKNLKSLPPQERPIVGKIANALKQKLIKLFDEKKSVLEKEVGIEGESFDPTLPGRLAPQGAKHPLTLVMDEIVEVFLDLGFKVEEGREIDTEYYNFEALNIPSSHPSREMFDTFYLDIPPQGNYRFLLRSHTSPSQVHILKSKELPCRYVVPGRVYRPDNMDASHSFMFHQIEGFWVDTDVKFPHLKGALSFFAKRIFGRDVRIRFRPHYFPFTEPSAEVDISCFLCKGKGCSVCKKTGFLEVLGAGMIHPQVLKNCGIDPKKWKGFAFGMGVERIAMLKYRIDDIRLFYENDIRFLENFI